MALERGEYQEIKEEDLEPDEWKKLSKFLERVSQLCEKKYLKNYDIDESPPSISENKFKPNGWIGTYPGNVVIKPSRITSSEYQQMKEELTGWLEFLGPPSIEAFLPFFPSEILDLDSLLASYSEMLVNFTEILLAHGLLKEVKPKVRIGEEVRGKPVFKEIMKLKYRDPTKIASQHAEVSFRSLSNFLLSRFHAEVTSGLERISEASEFLKNELRPQLSYHYDFLGSEVPSNLLHKSLEMDFLNPETLDRARRESSPQMQEIVDLWEAFKGKMALELDIREKLDVAIKPMSKVYELWCLKKMCDFLSEVFEKEPEPPTSFPWKFDYGRGKNLYYNKRVHARSRFIKSGFGKYPGRPDLAIEVSDKIIWVGDAKYKPRENIGKEEYMRFLSYLVDYMPASKKSPGFIFHIPSSRGEPASIKIPEIVEPDYQISRVPLTPSNVPKIQDRLTEYFDKLIVR
ncbi:hypothetical protein AKJ43_03390 [candidate division MSBL1 archaeon SCGC-AAA261D19]|uniref:DUF2357 domain-containing protein n=1 Tax=candidate division MSBL1 archaeon SCGC-AAA261D19 TaxID=1698273 RepID=A0A133V4Q2_9EURY|nr:hypothetical protein AKJ43_03390 [candidate division MSBL1 archaeon SCGC-AAA261D19]